MVVSILVFVSLPWVNGCKNLLEGETERPEARGGDGGGGQANKHSGLGPLTTWLLKKFV